VREKEGGTGRERYLDRRLKEKAHKLERFIVQVYWKK